MRNSSTREQLESIWRVELWGRFVILGGAVGLLVGLWEARLLYFVPSVEEFLVVDGTWVIWFLPSLAAIHAGLLPHQSGANAFRPLNPGWKTIESILGHHGYATAGFNANYYYGESGWGLGGWFGRYDDDRTTLLYMLKFSAGCGIGLRVRFTFTSTILMRTVRTFPLHHTTIALERCPNRWYAAGV